VCPSILTAMFIPHVDGRVVRDGAVISGEYVAGWIKRGPTGIIGTNKKDAAASVASLLADAGTLPAAPHSSRNDFDAFLQRRDIDVIPTTGWRAIDAAERALGSAHGRDRTTIHDQQDLLRAAVQG